MNPIRYVKENGIKHFFEVLYKYKLDKFFLKVNKVVFKGRLKNVILIESHNDFDCNGGAFYNYLIKNRYNEKYKIVWLLKNEYNGKLPKNVYGYHMEKPSFMKNYYRTVAKYITCDNSIQKKCNKKQKLFYLTHGGVTFKNVKGIVVVPDYVDYVISPSANFDPYMCQNYSIKYPNKKMLHFGFPRDDCYFYETKNEMRKLTEKKYSKYILWMPTFRKGGSAGRNDSEKEQPLGIPLIDSIEMYKELNEYLRKVNCYLIIKIHPMQDLSNLGISDLSNIKVLVNKNVRELDIDVDNLMKYSDALISDYSSVAYHYLLLNRPTAFVLEDLDDYKLGFSVDNIDDFLAGPKIYKFSEMIDFISDVANDNDLYKEKRTGLRSWLYEYTDDNACKRLVEFMNL